MKENKGKEFGWKQVLRFSLAPGYQLISLLQSNLRKGEVKLLYEKDHNQK